MIVLEGLRFKAIRHEETVGLCAYLSNGDISEILSETCK